MLNDTAYTQKDKQASLPSDLSPRGNDAVEHQRRSQFLKSWGQYTSLPASPPRVATTNQSPAPPPRVTTTVHQPPTPPPRVPIIEFPAHDTIHRIFTVYSPEVIFTSDSGATDILIRACNSHILTDYTAYNATASPPGFDVANSH